MDLLTFIGPWGSDSTNLSDILRQHWSYLPLRNPIVYSLIKHVALSYHFIREKIQSGQLRTTYLPTKDKLADVLTKPLPKTLFQDTCFKIGVDRASRFTYNYLF